MSAGDGVAQQTEASIEPPVSVKAYELFTRGDSNRQFLKCFVQTTGLDSKNLLLVLLRTTIELPNIVQQKPIISDEHKELAKPLITINFSKHHLTLDSSQVLAAFHRTRFSVALSLFFEVFSAGTLWNLQRTSVQTS